MYGSLDHQQVINAGTGQHSGKRQDMISTTRRLRPIVHESLIDMTELFLRQTWNQLDEHLRWKLEDIVILSLIFNVYT